MKVFISHSSHDRWVARKISEDLEARGVETFLDAKDITTGDSIDESIRIHLADCDDILIIISPASLKSHWVYMEVGGASALKKKLVPILLNTQVNAIPQPISRYLARDINEIDVYYDELDKRTTVPAVAPVIKRPTPRPQPRLEVGTRVRIVDPATLSDKEKEADPGWIDSMDKYAGRVTVVEGVEEDEGWLYLDIGEGWLWHPDWLIPIVE